MPPRVEALQEAAHDYAVAAQAVAAWWGEPERWEADPPPAPVAAPSPGAPSPGPWPFDRSAHWQRGAAVLEQMADAGSRLRRYGQRVRDPELRRLSGELRTVGSRVMVDPVMDDVKRLAEALESRVGEVLRTL